MTRIAFKIPGGLKGWVSVKASDGSALLREAGGDDTDEDTDYSTEASEGSEEDGWSDSGSEHSTRSYASEASYASTTDSVSSAGSSILQKAVKAKARRGPDSQIQDLCAAGHAKAARTALKALRQSGGTPSATSMSALVAASAAESLPQCFKLLQYALELPIESMPASDGLVAFLIQCKAACEDPAAPCLGGPPPPRPPPHTHTPPPSPRHP